MSLLDVSMRQRTPTPRKLTSALPALEDADRKTTTRPITIANMPGYRTVVIPEGTTVELIGYSARSGLPLIRHLPLGIDDAIVSPDAIGLADQPTSHAHSQKRKRRRAPGQTTMDPPPSGPTSSPSRSRKPRPTRHLK